MALRRTFVLTQIYVITRMVACRSTHASVTLKIALHAREQILQGHVINVDRDFLLINHLIHALQCHLQASLSWNTLLKALMACSWIQQLSVNSNQTTDSLLTQLLISFSKYFMTYTLTRIHRHMRQSMLQSG